MIYVEAPTYYAGEEPAIFLAGGITSCPDWQRDAVELLSGFDCTVFNPRQENFDVGDPYGASTQVDWEFTHLRRANVVLFWFPESPSPQPIALYELGYHAASGKKLAVGCNENYTRRFDVRLQLAYARPDVPVFDHLVNVCAYARSLLLETARRGAS